MSNQDKIFKILYKICKDNNLKLVIQKINFNFNKVYDNLSDIGQKIGPNKRCLILGISFEQVLSIVEQFENYGLECLKNTKMVVLFVDTRGFRILYKDNYLSGFYSHMNIETNINKWFNRHLKNGLFVQQECCVCCINIERGMTCDMCFNTICRTCTFKLQTPNCPFCRKSYH